MLVAGGSTNVTTYFALRLSADGKAATGLTITDFDLQYVRSGAAPSAKVDATALAATDSAHADNKAIEIDATDQPGLYRVDWPDAAFAAGVREVILSVKVATAFTEHLRVEIDGEVTAEALGTQAKADVNAEADTALTDYGAVKPTTAGRTLDIAATGEADASVTKWLGFPVTSQIAGKPDVNTDSIKASVIAADVFSKWMAQGKSSTADSGTTTTLVDAALTEADDFWNNYVLVITGGTNQGHTAVITDFDAASDTLTFTPASPSGITTETYILLPGLGLSNVQAWLGTAVSAGTAGIPNVNVEEINNTIPAVHALRDWLEKGIRLTADSGTTTTLVDAGLTQADGYWRGSLLVFRTGTNSGRTAAVTAFDAASDEITFTPAVPDAVTTEGFALIPGLGWAARDLANTTDGLGAIKTEISAALVALGLDHLISASVSDTDVADNSIIAEMVDAGSTSDYTNYSKTEDSLRAISEKVSSIGSASGGGFNFAAVGSDALTDTINNLGVAVDKGTSPATVGIPVNGHAFLAGHEVTIGGTDNYDAGSPYVIDSVSTNEVVIVSSFTAEEFAGSDTIVSSIKGDSIEGIETTNTFASTVSEDGVYHVIDDVGPNNFTISYRFEVGGGRLATEAVFHGFLNGSNDNAFIQAYNFVGDAWETRVLLTGQNGSANQTITISLLTRNTGTSGVDLGVVFLRITDDTGRGSSNPTLNVDSLLVEAVGVGQSVGHANGAIWADSVSGTDGSEAFVNGVADNPAKTMANIVSLLSSVGLHRVEIAPGSSFTFGEEHTDETWGGRDWTLALGGRDITGAFIFGASVTGVGTATSEYEFEECDIGAVTLDNDGHFEQCALEGTFTVGQAGTFTFHGCFTESAAAVTIDFAAVGATAIHLFAFDGEINFKNMAAGDTVHITGAGTISTETCTAGTIDHDGFFEYTDSGGNVTEQQSDIKVAVDAIKVPTDKMVFTVANQVDSNMLAISGDTTAADNLEESATTIVVGAAEAGTLSTTQMTSDLTEATNDHYIGRTVIWVTGVLAGQGSDITGYLGSTGMLTYNTVTDAPSATDVFVIV